MARHKRHELLAPTARDGSRADSVRTRMASCAVAAIYASSLRKQATV